MYTLARSRAAITALDSIPEKNETLQNRKRTSAFFEIEKPVGFRCLGKIVRNIIHVSPTKKSVTHKTLIFLLNQFQNQ